MCDKGSNNVLYDMACSLGERCMVAHQMRLHGLRSLSNPFDWLISGNLDAVIDILLTAGECFFQKDNLKIENQTTGHFRVTDMSTGIISLHDFADDQPFELEYEKFILKYKHRLSRLLNMIQDASSILFVRTNVKETDIDKLLSLQQLNPAAKMDFLIVNTIETDTVSQLASPYENVFIYNISNQPDVSYDVWMGNHAHWKTVLSNFSIKVNEDWLYRGLVSLIKDKKLVIWGFGGAGKKMLSQLKAYDEISIGWIIDSNAAKWGLVDGGIEIKSSDSLNECRSNVFVLICVYGDTLGIEKSLKEMQFPKDAVMRVVYEGLTPIKLEKCSNI